MSCLSNVACGEATPCEPVCRIPLEPVQESRRAPGGRGTTGCGSLFSPVCTVGRRIYRRGLSGSLGIRWGGVGTCVQIAKQPVWGRGRGGPGPGPDTGEAFRCPSGHRSISQMTRWTCQPEKILGSPTATSLPFVHRSDVVSFSFRACTACNQCVTFRATDCL